MPINDLPKEILDDILLLATKANEADGERFTYGLTQVSAIDEASWNRAPMSSGEGHLHVKTGRSAGIPHITEDGRSA